MTTGGDQQLVAARAASRSAVSAAVASPEPEVVTETAEAEGQLTASRDAPVGGQAVLEGVMMRGVAHWAVAVRTPAPEGASEGTLGEIEVRDFPLVSWSRKRRAYRLPVIRGVVALGESLGIGLRALGISANAQLPPGEEGGTAGEAGGQEQEISRGAWFGTVLVSVVFAIGLFFVVPVGLTSLIKDQLGSSLLFWVVEGVLRTSIFLGYLVLLSKIPDLRRVFEYHGAEHKVISCYEAGEELSPVRAQRYSRLHPRCGTSFLLIVMIMAIFVFAPRRTSGVVDPRVDADPRRAPDRRAVLRGDQVGGTKSCPPMGAGGHVPRPAVAAPDHARARSRSARRVDRRAGGGARARDPRRERRRPGRPRSRRLSGVRGPAAASGACRRAFSPPEHAGRSRPRSPNKENDMSDGKVDDAKGRVKEAAGDLSGDQSLKNEGKVDKASGKAKDAVGGTADKLKDAVNPDH